jgi:hypothetical protein
MRGVYGANYRIAGVTTGKTLLYITVPSTIVVDILSCYVTNESNETNEQLLCCLQRVTTLGTPTATTITPTKAEKGDQAAASTVKANVTASEPTYGAIAQGGAIVDADGLQGFPSLSGWAYQPTPEERQTIAPGDTWGLRLVNTITSADLCVQLNFQERG